MKPEDELLKCFPSQIQVTIVMSLLNAQSHNSLDKEHIGKSLEPFWAEKPVTKAAFERCKGRLMNLEDIIDKS